MYAYCVRSLVERALDRHALKNRNSYSNINSRINRIKDTSKRSTALLLLNTKNDKKEDLDQIGKLVDDMINEERERK
ncbi:hypothetical protein [Mycoplasmopsis edwardii]|nr:hypothetical protein [Mycoplasmopsis edwardii]